MSLDGSHLPLVAFLVVIAAALVAAVFDVRRFCVPNVLTGSLAVLGLMFHASVGEGLTHGLSGVAVGLGLLLIFYIVGVMGAGDVKLLAAVGAWIGAGNTLYVFCVAGVGAGIYSLVVLGCQGRLREIPAILQVTFLQLVTLGRHLARSESVAAATQRPDRRRYVMPFAAMIAVGVVAVAASAATLEPMAAGTAVLAIALVALAARGLG